MKSKDKISLPSMFVMILVLPLVINYFTYFAFTSNYTKNIFSEESFKAQFENDIYQYRVLSRELVIITYDILKEVNPKVPQKETIKYLDPNGDVYFYASLFIYSSIFLCLFSLVLTIILNESSIGLLSKLAVYLSIILIIALSQFTLVPYDIPGYFFNLLGYYLSFKYLKNNNINYIILLVLIIIFGTLNRETTALNLSFHFTLFYMMNKDLKVAIKQTLLPLLGFLTVYVSLRLFLESNESVVGFFSLLTNLKNFENLMGLIFILSSLFLFYSFSSEIIKKHIKIFILTSLPYLIVIISNGILYEIRLIIPALIAIISFQILIPNQSADKQ